jgi:hypothetical protein
MTRNSSIFHLQLLLLHNCCALLIWLLPRHPLRYCCRFLQSDQLNSTSLLVVNVTSIFPYTQSFVKQKLKLDHRNLLAVSFNDTYHVVILPITIKNCPIGQVDSFSLSLSPVLAPIPFICKCLIK